MPDGLENLEASAREFRSSADFDFVDPKRLAAVIDGLQGDLCQVLNQAKKRGEHMLTGQTPCSWVAQTCGLTPNAASDRLCVGKHLEAMPRVTEALGTGEIGYQGGFGHLSLPRKPARRPARALLRRAVDRP